MTPTDTLLRWLPADSRAGVARRAVVVWGMALVIALFQWITRPQEHMLDRSLVYSYAVSTCIWLLSDPLRILLRRWFGATGPHYWVASWRTGLHILLAVVVGYTVGTLIGDAYAGHSTWELLVLSPQRFWGFWLSTMAISAGFVVYFYLREKGLDLERQATEARLKLLETQLEPHMLFNTLANLRALIATDPPRAIHMLDRLNDYLRATLRGSRIEAQSGVHTLADEAARLRDYLELMAVRMGPRLSRRFELPEDLLQHPVPPLLLQPLVENAIRHGLEPRIEGGQITLRAQREGERWLGIEVADTGVGTQDTKVFESNSDSGFGLAQVHERIAKLAGAAGSIEFVSTPGVGTTVRLRLPLQASFKT